MADTYFRPDSAFTGGSSSGYAFLNNGSAIVTMTGAVASGEIVTMHEDGTVRRLNEATPISAACNNGVAPMQMGPVSNDLLTPLLKLPNGNMTAQASGKGYIVGPMGSGGGVVNASGTATWGPSHDNVWNLGVGSSAIPTSFVLPATDSSFVAINGSMVVYDKTGTQTVAPVNPFSGTAYATDGALLAGGHIVLLGTIANGIYAAIMTTAGVQVGSNVTISTLGGGAQILCSKVIPCANGDFLVAFNTTQSEQIKLYRYDSTGTSVWGPTTIGMGVGGAAVYCLMWELGSGVIAVLTGSTNNNSTPAAWSMWFYTSAGVLINEYKLPTGYMSWTQTSLSAGPYYALSYGFVKKGGLFLVSANNLGGNNGVSLVLDAFDTHGYGVSHREMISGLPSSLFGSSNQYQIGFSAGLIGAGVGLVYPTANATMFAVAGFDGNLRGQPIAINSVSSGEWAGVLSNGDGMAYVGYMGGFGNMVGNASIGRSWGTSFQCAKSSILGVAQASVGNGATATVNAAGAYTLPASQVMLSEGGFNCNANDVIGTRGVIGATQAFLGGWR